MEQSHRADIAMQGQETAARGSQVNRSVRKSTLKHQELHIKDSLILKAETGFQGSNKPMGQAERSQKATRSGIL